MDTTHIYIKTKNKKGLNCSSPPLPPVPGALGLKTYRDLVKQTKTKNSSWCILNKIYFLLFSVRMEYVQIIMDIYS